MRPRAPLGAPDNPLAWAPPAWNKFSGKRRCQGEHIRGTNIRHEKYELFDIRSDSGTRHFVTFVLDVFLEQIPSVLHGDRGSMLLF